MTKFEDLLIHGEITMDEVEEYLESIGDFDDSKTFPMSYGPNNNNLKDSDDRYIRFTGNIIPENGC